MKDDCVCVGGDKGLKRAPMGAEVREPAEVQR